MVKVLKSFKSAHSAVNWMSQNRIEDTSIETTGTLKSLGHSGAVPSGNYHVVLKSEETTRPDPIPTNEIPPSGSRAEGRVKDAEGELSGASYPYQVAQGQGGTPAVEDAKGDLISIMSRHGESLGLHPEEDNHIKIAHELAPHLASGKPVTRELIGQTAASLRQTRQGTPAPASSAQAPMVQGTLFTSIPREDLVNIITKSVVEVLKSLK
jgi:hypothetical protein